MANAFGNYISKTAAEADILALGFKPSATTPGVYWQRSATVGNLYEAPRETTALARVVKRPIAAQYGGGAFYQIEYL